jgi:predicted lipid-binding transport protein (Tim44 family)
LIDALPGTELLQRIANQRKKVQALKSKKTTAVTRAQQLAAHVETVKQIQSDFSDVAPKMTQLGAFQDAVSRYPANDSDRVD